MFLRKSWKWQKNHVVDRLRKQDEPAVGAITLRQVLEFCACFSSGPIRHDLTFGQVREWRVARLLVDAAEDSGLELVAMDFHQDQGGCLCIALKGDSGSGIVALYRGIAAVPDVRLVNWQSRADSVRTA